MSPREHRVPIWAVVAFPCVIAGLLIFLFLSAVSEPPAVEEQSMQPVLPPTTTEPPPTTTHPKPPRQTVPSSTTEPPADEEQSSQTVPTTTEPPFGRYEMETLGDDVIFVYGAGGCLGDMRWTAAKNYDPGGLDPPECPTPDLDGRYVVEAECGGEWAAVSEHDPSECGFAIQPWREPRYAQSQGWCWRSRFDGSVFDTADCPGPQFLSVSGTVAGVSKWTIAFTPEEG